MMLENSLTLGELERLSELCTTEAATANPGRALYFNRIADKLDAIIVHKQIELQNLENEERWNKVLKSENQQPTA